MLHRCTTCRRARLLLLRVAEDEWLCARCWKDEGEPASWSPPETQAELHEQQATARKRMLKHGGHDRYMVLAGKT